MKIGVCVQVGMGLIVWAGAFEVLVAAADSTDVQQGSSFRYDAKGHRDPFVPLIEEGRVVNVKGSTGSSGNIPTLYGILWDPEGQSIALINNTEVKVGDSVGFYQVKEIQKDSVVLNNDGEPVVLHIAFEPPLSGVEEVEQQKERRTGP